MAFTSSNKAYNNLETGVISTLAFFGLYQVPVTVQQVFQFLYKTRGSLRQVQKTLGKLAAQKIIYEKDGLYSLKFWQEEAMRQHLSEKQKRIQKVNKYFRFVAALPYVRLASLINSLAIGNVRQESDIDFFLVVKPGFLYFSRSLIILLFKLLGVYKTRKAVAEHFCFGFFVSQNAMELEKILISPEDPYTAFWLASMRPIFNKRVYLNFIEENNWIFEYLPNFMPLQHFYTLRQPSIILKIFKLILEIILWLPATILEPVLRYIHIRHTFSLPENHWPTSTTIANSDMLKLHALDPRSEIRDNFFKLIQDASACKPVVAG